MTKDTLNWQKIYEKHSPKLLGICRRYVSDIFAAEDIIHDSFIVAIQKNGQLKDENALFAWLKTIVVNNALQYLRKQSKESFSTTENTEIPDTHAEMEQTLLEDKHVLVYDFTTEELLSSIDQLPDHHKSVFNLYFMENFSHAEISNTLGITVNTSKSHLLRAKKSVREFLLNQVVTENTPKNKIAQLLIFFGMGSLLWAQNFHRQFSNFSIQPQKKFETSEGIVQGNISYSNSILMKKLAVSGSLLLLFFTFILAFNPKEITSLPHKKNNDKTEFSLDKKHETNIKAEANPSNIKTKIAETSNLENVTNENTEIINDKGKTLSKMQNSTKKTPKKDTIKETVQQIVVVKKIIKRDTIFIEK